MGRAKNDDMEQYERGWYSIGNKFVCKNCFSDDELTNFVLSHATSKHCDYCGRNYDEFVVAPIDEIMELIADSIYSEWTDPNEELLYKSAEGGYQGDVLDTYDLLCEIEFPIENEQLWNDVANSLSTTLWCRRNQFSLPESKELFYTWNDFCNLVKYETRYLFFNKKPSSFIEYKLQPSEILDKIGELAYELELSAKFSKGTEFYRGRIHKSNIYLHTASELGTCPPMVANQSNRMSPSGIPMFYGAIEKETVIKEVFDQQKGWKNVITIARFETVRDIYLLDLTKLPPVPSLFSESKRHLRGVIGFLQDFVVDLSKPIQKNGFEDIEYVPTQIVTEYFRHRYIDQYGNQIYGIIYPSSRQDKGRSVVVFASSEQCIDSEYSDNKNALL